MRTKPERLIAIIVGVGIFLFGVYKTAASCINLAGRVTNFLTSDCFYCTANGSAPTGATTCSGETYSPADTCGWDLSCGYTPQLLFQPGPEGTTIELVTVNVATANLSGSCSGSGCTATVGTFGPVQSKNKYGGVLCQ